MLNHSSCNACGGRLSPWLEMPLDPKKDEANPFPSVARCDHCGLGSLSPVPDTKDIPGFYELPAYYTHGASHMTEHPSSMAAKILTKLAWLADHGEQFDPGKVRLSLGASICDLGCGHANYLKEFKARGCIVVGVEPDAAARQEAAKAGITVLEGTAEDPPPLNAEFDLVLCTHALEHCRDPKHALENAFRATKPGGFCYIEVPNCASEHFRTFTISSEMFDAPRHIYFFTPDALVGLAERVGFIVIKRLFSGYTRDFSPTWRAWETSIAERVSGRRHSFRASVALFLRSFWRRPQHKYDSVGLLLMRPHLANK